MTNDLLKMLVGMSDGGLSGSVNLIGKTVTAATDRDHHRRQGQLELRPGPQRHEV